ncbi:acetyl-CoA carboxylase biotin carboxyl carrier protein [Burkholderia cenocepacia]|uniref:Biotin carboxyl carrier protein of acetyl-CoA carboxylase n=1 Tax=Burkholderia cenocepacia TaxID=95486 RepID=A0A6B2MK82_9BURK|nr:acetyl-CoA carboxylase biotin carboxyl carrier protein [Burkholderia cenocepacia]MBN3505795.1 acetyl-CoA carboxylase biotin carboxyl carrier protein [Burkholderia cenocepacia]MCO1392615.1 acetyl-CoA carboxylase biotin carboxyl carrier protein [Burkholderia cenocepacia]MCO1406568.1 acetyl-CoA carboxylase biotin carboxyl carrier protein [Burkholderia cenocepacia]MDI9675686.1 acetyl-CoA carboxylase biotin carboxyl carrier protein [Burkholderia cenocepacia]NDV75181.1 acetyl-CoA carboxylase biot
MSDKQLTYEDVREIIKLVEEADKFGEFRLRYNDIEISLSKNAPVSAVAAQAQPSALRSESVIALVEQASSAIEVPEAPSKATSTTASSVRKEWPPHFVTVRAPMVGTFYCAPEPGAKPFVSVGDVIAAHDTVCIIEVMKLMNALSAESGGVVREILVSDGDTVEYGQPLVVIEPAS